MIDHNREPKHKILLGGDGRALQIFTTDVLEMIKPLLREAYRKAEYLGGMNKNIEYSVERIK